MRRVYSNNEEYDKWRAKIRRRDKYKCRMPNCSGESKRLHVHHILPWSKYPSLRYDIGNGITLCSDCHKTTFRKEDIFAPLFLSLLSRKGLDIYLEARKKYRDKKI